MNKQKTDMRNLPSPEPTSSDSNANTLFNPQSALRKTIQKWQQKLAVDIERQPNLIAAASAAEARRRYRLEKAVEGKTVRPYKKHKLAPFQFGETHESHRKRTHKERQRIYRGVTAETVRSWTDLSVMSEEEKADHIKQKNRERQKKWRQKSEPTTNDLHTEIAKALEDFDC
ncbi:hypothetical protein HNQ68_003147 [Pseudochrobactrum saccharolyticum]|uniref:Uncharacterized protein n=1 Tax=Pseudochrobactrum saccharolyticum TaxID=354352 RepID=A0A7W8ANT4_9HYPH|nr:hypothetical protein [Pseudochrobactrum saccharolyticum]KAB0537036.1 hypothetical protein F7P81_16550 [Pseudochrobactrum saccharolyticum]MBB5092590.1 hypothetical protein [Pseudochrobactrum saccharolyticum]